MVMFVDAARVHAISQAYHLRHTDIQTLYRRTKTEPGADMGADLAPF